MAENIDFAITELLGVSGTYSKISSTDLVPDPTASGYYNTLAEGFGAVQAKLKYQKLSLRSQLRIESRDREVESFLDEAYAELLSGKAIFSYAGRRILSYGQSYGLNPADLLYDPVAENNTYSSSQSRAMSAGADLIGMDIVFDLGSTLSLIYVPDYYSPRLNTEESIGMAALCWLFNA